MDRKKTAITNCDNLNKPPHIVPELINMMIDECQPSLPAREQCLKHLIECLSCQVALGTLLMTELDYDRQAGCSTEPVQKLLSRLTEITHKTQIQEQMGGYIEALQKEREEEANKQFPIFAEHLKSCKDCHSTVEGTLSLLVQVEKAGVIAPIEGKDESELEGTENMKTVLAVCRRETGTPRR